ncbi:hypothetical protein ACWNT8_15750 (plasmid) [Pigmentibacter ruber]
MELLPSFICAAPKEKELLNKQSILIEDKGIETIVGELAQVLNPHSPRIYGGSLESDHYQTLLKAGLARALGEGKHVVSMALSVPFQYMDQFRDQVGDTTLARNKLNLLKETVANIRFKEKSTDSSWKNCEVIIQEEPTIAYEFLASMLNIPLEAKTFLYWHIGHGDWQQASRVDGKNLPDSYARVEGLAGAIQVFSEQQNLSSSEAIKSWQLGSMPEVSGMNGKRIDCLREKELAARQFIRSVVGELLNKNTRYKDRAKNIIVSGGASKDDVFMLILKEIAKGNGYNIILMTELVEDIDPTFSVVSGLSKLKSNYKHVSIDIGNSSVKVAVV